MKVIMDLYTLRHSCSHVLAQAVKRLYPDTKLGIGPSIESGFYYDFDAKVSFTPDDLEKIENQMQTIIKEDLPFKKEILSKKDAEELFRKLKEDYKLELIKDIPDETVSVYKNGDFVDLCRGPHIESTGEIKVFKLTTIAGAYWHGIETNPMLQRIYGTAFQTKKELEEYLRLIEEAKKRDHRRLGPQLGFFNFYDEAGAGLVIYHPKGAILRMVLEDYLKREHLKRGYQIVKTPHIYKSDIWIRSGHYEYYKENMYIFKVENQEFAVKPMNCPGHMLIYKSDIRSYRDLPIRLFELGDVYRHEKTGVLHGLLRVRGFTQDDAHIFCREDQLINEIAGVLDFVKDTMAVFGFSDFEFELSTRPTKSIGSDQDWNNATGALKDALCQKNLSYQINEGEGAFYGPKIDIKLKDAIGRSWQCATIQCDFALPNRFDLTYVGQDGKNYRPIMLHRVILGSLERFIGTLIEHFAGALPLWLSPVQVMIIPVSDKHADYAFEIKGVLDDNLVRTQLDNSQQTLSYKIRNAQLEKIPYMLIVGDREVESKKVSIRSRAGGDEGSITTEELIKKLNKEIGEKSHNS